MASQETSLVLYNESFAPWCERARWALDHHRILYAAIEHVPLVGEVRLRIKSGRLFSRASVPLLVGSGICIMDSAEIARFSDRIGEGEKLFPVGYEDEIARWIESSERLMCAGRARVLSSGRGALPSLREVSPTVPRSIEGLRDGASLVALAYLRKKYGTLSDPERRNRQAEIVVDELRKGTNDGKCHLVGGRLTFADIAMACALQFIRPVDSCFMRIGESTRELWTWSDLLKQSATCLQWRDAIYEKYRRTA